MQKIEKNDITGAILAGGRARRMHGEDKGLILFESKPLVKYVIDILSPQVGNLIINANRNHKEYAKYGFEIISDELSDYCGPLSGMASILNKIETPYLVTAPCDSPFLSTKLVSSLSSAMANENADISVAHNGLRVQPVFCMLKKTMVTSINEYLDRGERKIDKWFEQHAVAIADLSSYPESFKNFNSREELIIAEENSEKK